MNIDNHAAVHSGLSTATKSAGTTSRQEACCRGACHSVSTVTTLKAPAPPRYANQRQRLPPSPFAAVACRRPATVSNAAMLRGTSRKQQRHAGNATPGNTRQHAAVRRYAAAMVTEQECAAVCHTRNHRYVYVAARHSGVKIMSCQSCRHATPVSLPLRRYHINGAPAASQRHTPPPLRCICFTPRPRCTRTAQKEAQTRRPPTTSHATCRVVTQYRRPLGV